MKFRERLIELQDTRTQKEFAEHLEIPLNTYTNWLLQSRRPTMDAIISICTKLSVSADWLLGLTDDRGGVAPRIAQPSQLSPDKKVPELEAENAALKGEIRGLKGEIRGLQFALDSALKGARRAQASASHSRPA